MSMPTWEDDPYNPNPTPTASGTPAEPEQDAAPPLPPPDAETWSVISVIPHNGVEPPASVTDATGLAVWAAVSTLWHPAVLATLASLPKVEGVESPGSPAPRQIFVVAEGCADQVASGFRTQAADAGAVVLDGVQGRDATPLLHALNIEAPAVEPGSDLEKLIDDFRALGTAAWLLRDLTIGMGHADCLDHDNLRKETLTGARAWAAGDANAARNRLRAAFELLTQARERFYPVDAYIIDICLLDPALPGGVLGKALESRTPITFLASGRSVQTQSERDQEGVTRLCEAITEGWADVAGGAWDEAEEALLPLESILWQFRRGAEAYRQHLDHRTVETLARRRFGLYPILPQLAKRHGFRFAVHMGFDAGKFPLRAEAKRLWESPDHTNLEALTRPPLAADRPAQGVRIAWCLAASMREDHVATVPLIHWPAPLAGWYEDLRRVASYSPVLARWVTLNDFFHLTDRPYETFTPTPDEYQTPYLAQAVARKDADPVSRLATHRTLRSRIDALKTVRAMAEALGTGHHLDGVDTVPGAEEALETVRPSEAKAAVEPKEQGWPAAVAKGISGEATGGRPGFLIINPSGVPRRASVMLPEAAMDLRPEGPLRVSQFTDQGVVAVVELPAFGYAWVPRDANYEASPAPTGVMSAKERSLHNESLSIEFDPATGGIRSLKGAGDETPRLGQQIVIAGLTDASGAPASSKMRCDRFEVEYGGPALAQAVSQGAILGPDGRTLAGFRQQVRIWSGRPTAEVEIELRDVDADWLAAIADADPWTHYLACRWAWPDPNSMLRRTSLLSPELTEADRPETPDAIDISTRRQRTGLLFAGLPYHRKHGTRMLDTLLVAGREAARTFRLGVVLDLENPHHAILDLNSPTFVVPTETGPPRTGPSGWLFKTDNKGVAVTSVDYVDATEEGRGWGLVFHLTETTGRPARCRLRTFRNPSWARQVDFQNEVIVDLPVDGDAVSVDFTPYEIARVEVTLG